MTLAIILLFGISWTAPAFAQDAAAGQATTQPAQSQGNQPPAQNPSPEAKPSTASPAKTSGPSHPPAKRPRRKKKVVPVNCVAAAAAAAPTTATPATPDPPSTPPTSTASGTTSSAPTNCPPPKIIVRQGGTAEPSIQLAGGDGGAQEARQRETTNQMLGATEQNLKKLAGLQLSQDQQGIVTQVRQFMEQSKTAAAAGDLERARTLAWKAQLLSEELIKPQK